jgi:CheY-like chemotaxis protein
MPSGSGSGFPRRRRRVRCSGDPDRLGQAIGNVVGNAIKFSPEDGEIEVSFRQSNNDVEIKVGDRGPGIDPRFLPSLFDRFSQEDRSSTRRHGGLGLGLSIAKHIIELHGGTIAAANREGGGALFTIRLPESSAESPLLTLPGPGTSDRDNGLEPTLLRGRLVLVVDDEPSSREITAAVLERCGAEVFTASSTAEALDLLGARKPDAMVVDLAMPEQDGYHFLERARRVSRPAPALALTAHANASEEAKARHAGFDAFLSKPVDPVVLARTVSSMVRRDTPGPISLPS